MNALEEAKKQVSLAQSLSALTAIYKIASNNQDQDEYTLRHCLTHIEEIAEKAIIAKGGNKQWNF
jgi:hypothetical protein